LSPLGGLRTSGMEIGPCGAEPIGGTKTLTVFGQA
jgi:hypothetical protein